MTRWIEDWRLNPRYYRRPGPTKASLRDAVWILGFETVAILTLALYFFLTAVPEAQRRRESMQEQSRKLQEELSRKAQEEVQGTP